MCRDFRQSSMAKKISIEMLDARSSFHVELLSRRKARVSRVSDRQRCKHAAQRNTRIISKRALMGGRQTHVVRSYKGREQHHARSPSTMLPGLIRQLFLRCLIVTSASPCVLFIRLVVRFIPPSRTSFSKGTSYVNA